jgi:hypothetical protein
MLMPPVARYGNGGWVNHRPCRRAAEQASEIQIVSPLRGCRKAKD